MYRFNRCSSTPVLEDEVFLQIKPGLSSFESDPTKASESLQPLMDIALQSVPPELQSSTPLTLKATAGLRMLPDNKGELILGHVRAYLKAFPFQVDDKTVEIMDGKDEGLRCL